MNLMDLICRKFLVQSQNNIFLFIPTGIFFLKISHLYVFVDLLVNEHKNLKTLSLVFF
jgi:hypothetical protein